MFWFPTEGCGFQRKGNPSAESRPFLLFAVAQKRTNGSRYLIPIVDFFSAVLLSRCVFDSPKLLSHPPPLKHNSKTVDFPRVGRLLGYNHSAKTRRGKARFLAQRWLTVWMLLRLQHCPLMSPPIYSPSLLPFLETVRRLFFLLVSVPLHPSQHLPLLPHAGDCITRVCPSLLTKERPN